MSESPTTGPDRPSTSSDSGSGNGDQAGPADHVDHRERGGADGSGGRAAASGQAHRRGSRGGRSRSRSGPRPEGELTGRLGDQGDARQPEEMPDPPAEGRASPEAAERALVRRKPQIGDTMPAPAKPSEGGGDGDESTNGNGGASAAGGSGSTGAGRKRRRRGGRGRGGSSGGGNGPGGGAGKGGGRRPAQGDRGGGKATAVAPVEGIDLGEPVELDEEVLAKRRGRARKGRPVGRYLMAVHVRPEATQIAVLEGRALIEHYVSRPTDDISQIHGNIYLGKVQNVLPGMEAAFVDIGTPKNAVLYRGDVRYDPEDVEERSANPRIEQMLKAKQTILCQVSKNPIGAKGARLTQEVSLPGRFVVLVPDSGTFGISKRLPDQERKRLRAVLDRAKLGRHGVIVRTAAEGITAAEIERDLARLVAQWEQIEQLASKAKAPALLYREPDMAVRVIREEFNKDYRKVVIDDRALFDEVSDYVATISPALAERVELFDTDAEPLPILERFHVHEQLHRGLDRKVWLPSGGSLVIDHTEALTVIDVNTSKNVGSSNLEDTVYANNLEAAEEIAHQLRLRDIGGIIVIDFIDMEIKRNREDVIRVFREALARDKTRTQVFDISELGLVEMTRKRIGEGLLESFTSQCPMCEGRGVVFDQHLLD